MVATSAAHAGQVLLSCDLAGFQGVDDIQVKKTSAGLEVNLFMVDEKSTYYSLPAGEPNSRGNLDLSGFLKKETLQCFLDPLFLVESTCVGGVAANAGSVANA